MYRKQGDIPVNVNVAFSGGVDSVAVAMRLKRCRSLKYNLTLLYFDHGTNGEMGEFVYEFSEENNIPLIVGNISGEKPKDESQEEYWRNQRYAFLDKHSNDEVKTITCHHLDDCIETYIFSCMHGQGKIIPYKRNNIIRPYRLTKKEAFVKWCQMANVKWYEDRSNTDIKYMRNFIRYVLRPQCEVINPGLDTVIYKKIRDDFI